MTAPTRPLHAARVVQAKDTDWLGSQAWPGAAEGLAWHRFMQQANVRQLTMLGFPEPGHPYWTDETFARRLGALSAPRHGTLAAGATRPEHQ